MTIELPEKVRKWNFQNLGWFSQEAALQRSKDIYVVNYTLFFGLERPSNNILPHRLPGLVYAGRAGGGKKLLRTDFKNKWKSTKKTLPHDRMSAHNTETQREFFEDIEEEKYKWLWNQRQVHPTWQIWVHFYTPNLNLPLDEYRRMKICVCSIEQETIELYYDYMGHVPPMNREHRWDITKEDKESRSTIYHSTDQTLEQFFVKMEEYV